MIPLTIAGDEPVRSISYTATHAKQADGSWQIAASHSQSETTTPAEQIRPLHWMIGEWTLESEDEDAEDTPPPAPVNPDKLVGTKVSKVADEGTITLVMTQEGGFNWSFDKPGNSGKLEGEFGIYDSNLLVLISEDAQMVGEVTFTDDSKPGFILAGGLRGDPGLTFDRKE